MSGTATRVGNLGGDCESPSYPGRLARYYSFTLGQAGSVEIDLVSSAFDTFLALREGAGVAGRLVVSDDDGGQGTNSRIATELSAGTYTIEATSYGTGVTGAFTLTVTTTAGTLTDVRLDVTDRADNWRRSMTRRAERAGPTARTGRRRRPWHASGTA